MTSLTRQLESIDRQLADALAAAEATGEVRVGSDDELVAMTQVLGRLQRRLDGALTAVADRVVERDRGERVTRLSTGAGCRDAVDLLRRLLYIDGRSARRYVTAAAGGHRDLEITSGGLLPEPFPELSVALRAGEVSLSGYLACIEPLQKAERLSAADRLAADAVLARFATGRVLDDADPDAAGAECERGPVPTVDELAGMTAHIIDRIDPDGAEPRDDAGARRRHLTLGRMRDGSVPVRGELLPEVAAQLQKLIDALVNPRVDQDDPVGGVVRF